MKRLIPFLSLLVLVPITGLSQIITDSPAYKAMRAEEEKVLRVVDEVLNTVVCIQSLMENGAASGSGTIVSKDGLILTAAHVVGDAKEVVVQMVDGTAVPANVLGCNLTRDVAMVKIEPEEGEPAKEWPFATIGDSKNWKTTDTYIAMGHAGGYDTERPPPVRIGRAYNNHTDGDFIVSDCVVIGGDSGGPLFDLDGKVIGIHSFIGASLGENNHAPVHAVQDDWDRLLKGDKWGRMKGMLAGPGEGPAKPQPKEKRGPVSIEDIDPDEFAAFIQGVIMGAMQAGKDPETVLGDPKKLLREFGVPGKELRKLDEDEMLKLMLKAMGMDRAEPFSKEALAGLELPKGLKVEPFGDALMEMLQNGDELDDETLRALLKTHGARDEAVDGMKEGDLYGMVNQMLGEPPPTEQEKRDRDALNAQFEECLDGHQPSMEQAFKSMAGLFDGDKLVCHGLVVDPRGFLLSKASELDGAKALTATIQTKTYPAKVVKTWADHDLALVFVDADNLTAAQWATAVPPVGTYIASPNYDESIPIGVGLVAVGARSLLSRPFLGVGLGDEEDEVVITQVMPGSAADKAEMQVDDIILEMNGKAPENVDDFIQSVRALRVGDRVTLNIKRDDKEMEIKVVLGKREDVLGDGKPDEFDRMNEMSGEMSEVRTGFPTVLQTDLPVEPKQMGGPLVDLGGQIIGFNIARAGRIETYAIPSGTILDLLAEIDFNAMTKAERGTPAQPDVRAQLEAALKAVREARKALDQAERSGRKALEETR